MKTRDRILSAALDLFNEKGTSAVSTNHIAEASEMSPGNLYYHFGNKEEIIRALFEQWAAAASLAFSLPADRAPTLADLKGLVRRNFSLLWDYRFMYRELIALLQRDEALRRRWLEIRPQQVAGFHELVDVFVAVGVMRAPEDPAVVGRLADLVWLISEFWLASLEVSGKPVNARQMERGIDLMLQVLNPYIVST